MSFIIKLRWFLKQRWGYYLLAVTLMTIANILTVIPPKIIGNVVDQIRNGSLTASSLDGTVVFLVGLAVFGYILFFAWLNILFSSSILLEKLLRTRLLRHLTSMTPTFFQRNRTGELMALATNDIPAVGMTAGYGVLTLVFTVIGTSIVLIAMIALVNIKLMLAALLPLPFLALAVNKLGRVMRKRFLIAQESFGNMNDHALESISGLRVLRSYVQEEMDLQAFDRVTSEVMQKNIRVSFINALFQPVVSTIVGFSYAIGIGYGSYLVFHNEISLGQLITFNIYLGMLIWPMISFGEFINVLQRGSASVDRLEKSMMQQSDIKDDDHLISVALPTSIVMNNLTFRYPGSEVNSLSGVSLRIERGQTLGIVGRTGSGKSTLLKQLLRQYPIERHKLIISDIPVEHIAIEQMRKWIGYVPQEHLLLSKSIKDNITLGKPNADMIEIEKVVEMVSFTEDIERMEEGLDTIIGESGVMLSGGQKQRTAIARALLTDPEILLLDDAMSAVDARTENIILQNIRKQRTDKTTLITTHRLSAVSHAHWIIVFDEGKVIEEGTHEQLIFLKGWYKEQYDRQQLEASLLNDEKGTRI